MTMVVTFFLRFTVIVETLAAYFLKMSITTLATNGNGNLCHNGKTCFCDSKSETLEIDLTGTVSRDRFGF